MTRPKFALASPGGGVRLQAGMALVLSVLVAPPILADPQDTMRQAAETPSEESNRARSTQSPDALIQRGEECLENGQASEARNLFETALVLRPDDPRALLGLGRALTARRRYIEADAVYRDMEDRRIDAVAARLGRARLRALQGDHEGAQSFYKDVLQADPGNLDARLGLARSAHALGLDRRALAQADNLVLDHPGNEQVLDLQKTVHDALRPRLEIAPVVSRDDGDNRTRAVTGSYTFMADPQSAVGIEYTEHEAESPDPSGGVDAIRSEARALTGVVTSRLIRPLSFHARVGLEQQEPYGGGDRVVLFGDGSIRWETRPHLTVNAFAARRPLLDSAPLIDWGIRVDTGEMQIVYRYLPEWTLTADGELGRYSDGNSRQTATASVAWEPEGVRPRVTTTFDIRLRRFNDDRDYGYLDPIHYDSERLTLRLEDEEADGRFFWKVEGYFGRQSYDPNDFVRVPVASPDTPLSGGAASAGVDLAGRFRFEAYHVRGNDALQSAPGFPLRRSGFTMRIRF